MLRSASSRCRCFGELLTAICCLLAGSAVADDTVPFYSGDFPSLSFSNFWGPNAGAVIGGSVMYDGANPNLVYEFNFNAPISNFQETPWCGFDCPQYATGTINSGTVSFSGADESGQNPPYNFTGFILAGGTFSGEVVCDLQGCAWDENADFRFQSQSGSNGWMSSGELNISGGNDGSGGQDFGILSMTTQSATTPEPGTILLFGSGLAGLVGLARRKGIL